MKEYIICAAIHYDNDIEYEDQPQGIQFGIAIAGRRHSDCYETLRILSGMDAVRKVGRERQGFLTNTNRYVNRREAWDIAIAANQVVNGKNTSDKENQILISENLY